MFSDSGNDDVTAIRCRRRLLRQRQARAGGSEPQEEQQAAYCVHERRVFYSPTVELGLIAGLWAFKQSLLDYTYQCSGKAGGKK